MVLDGVNLDVPGGLITCIVGPSGGGKTVLLKHLNLLMRPDSGTITIDGTEVTRLRRSALDQVREKLGMLFQAGALFDSMSIFDNVAFPLVEKTHLSEDEIAVRVQETLKSVGLENVEDKFPSELSGGMQKRAALARALIHRPENSDARRADHRPRSFADRRDSSADSRDPAKIRTDRRNG